jgi:hypothetical protein
MWIEKENLKVQILKIALLSFFCLGFGTVGCGGGTVGTSSPEESRVEGVLISSDNNPIEGATVSIGETGDSGTTRADGHFDFDALDLRDSVTLLVESNSVDARATLDNIADNPLRVFVVLVFDISKRELTIRSKEITARPTPVPTTAITR